MASVIRSSTGNLATSGAITVTSLAIALSLTGAPASAATCPFDAGASDALNDGVVLTRYALGITGSPLTASTRYASIDPLQVKNNIECVGCALDINGDGQIDTADTTIIARHLVGFQGASLTGGLALGVGARNTTAAVTSFLANGCAVGGAINAFVQGGNAFGTAATVGTTDNQQMEVRSAGNAVKVLLNGENGLRILRADNGDFVDAPAVVNGSASNSIGLTPFPGATIAGGGHTWAGCNDPLGTTRPCSNRVSDAFGSIGGGVSNRAAYAATVLGGVSDSATAGFAMVSGGNNNTSSGQRSTVPGGENNTASGDFSFAAGRNATAGDRSFVWNSYNSYNSYNNLPTRTDSFRVQAANGFDVAFGPNRDYFVAFNADTAGFIITTSTGAKLSAGGVWTNNSDRAKKRDFSPITTQSAQDILRKVVALSLSTWSYFAEDAKIRHIGPMAQDFWKAFGLGYDDKTMTDIDARGVTLAAIQGLNQIVKDRDGEIAKLKSRLAAIERRLRVK